MKTDLPYDHVLRLQQFSAPVVRQVEAWNAAAKKAGTPCRVFCPPDAVDQMVRAETRAEIRFGERFLELVRDTPDLTWLVPTTTPELVLGWMARVELCDVAETLPQLWLGVAAVLQEEVDDRVPELMDLPADRRFLWLDGVGQRLNLAPHLPHAFNREPTCPWCESCIPDTAGSVRWKSTTEDDHGPFLDWVVLRQSEGCTFAAVAAVAAQCVKAETPLYVTRCSDPELRKFPTPR
mgnify:CR=1 FL=1